MNLVFLLGKGLDNSLDIMQPKSMALLSKAGRSFPVLKNRQGKERLGGASARCSEVAR